MYVIVMALVSFLLTVLLGRFLIPILRALKAGQSIREVGPSWHQTKSGTPTMGGLMFMLPVLLCVVIGGWSAMRQGELGHLMVLGFSLVFGLIGFIDDFVKVKLKRNLGLTSLQKFLLQLAVALAYLALLRWNGDLTNELYIPFFDVSLTVKWVVYLIFAIFVIVGCVNAVNLTDGVDGLSSSVTVPVMVFFAAAAIVRGKFDLALLPACLVGGLIAYLFYNWHPAKVFMGDTGSLFLGGVVCALAFALDMPLILILVGFVYIVETLSVILQVLYFKLTHGKRLFKMSPIHHHFEMCGWKEKKICIVFSTISAIMCILAWFGIA